MHCMKIIEGQKVGCRPWWWWPLLRLPGPISVGPTMEEIGERESDRRTKVGCKQIDVSPSRRWCSTRRRRHHHVNTSPVQTTKIK